jgi:hypothetical protein
MSREQEIAVSDCCNVPAFSAQYKGSDMRYAICPERMGGCGELCSTHIVTITIEPDEPEQKV